MIFSKESIERCVAEGKITITPYDSANLKEASYTFTLQDSITLAPGAFVVVLTKEKITLPKDICCFLSTRGSVAQLGIDALQSSFFVEPLSDHQLKLEIKNNSDKEVTLQTGTQIVKGIFLQVE